MNSLNELNGREMQARLEKSGIRAQKVVKRRYTGHYTAEFYTPTLDAAVAPAREWSERIERGLGNIVQILEARDTCADWRPGKPIIAASVTFAVLDKAPVKPAASKAQQQAEATPHTPASVDGFLFGVDVDVKRLQAHELHDADGAPVEDKDARIRQLEALVEEAAQVIAPIVKFQNEATEWIESSGTGRKPLFGLHVRYAGDWEFLSGDMRAETLTNLFAFAAKLDAVLKK